MAKKRARAQAEAEDSRRKEAKKELFPPNTPKGKSKAAAKAATAKAATAKAATAKAATTLDAKPAAKPAATKAATTPDAKPAAKPAATKAATMPDAKPAAKPATKAATKRKVVAVSDSEEEDVPLSNRVMKQKRSSVTDERVSLVSALPEAILERVKAELSAQTAGATSEVCV